MKTCFALLLIALAGCGPSPSVDYTPIIATELGLAAVAADVGPSPSPSPTPGNVCPNCRGTGKVGDGTIMVPCVPCDGTGRIVPSSADAPAIVLGLPVHRGKCGCVLDRMIRREDGRWVHEDCPCGLNCICERTIAAVDSPQPIAVEATRINPRTHDSGARSDERTSTPRRRFFRFRGR